MQPRRQYQQLKSMAGADTVTIDITTSSRTASFKLDNLPVKKGREWCYAEKIRLYIRTQVDQPAAAGSIIRHDQLGRILANIVLKCDDLGILYSESDITGQQLYLIAQVVSNGYKWPFIPREDVAAADGDTALTLIVDIPLAHKCFFKGHQTGLWNGWFRQNGQLDVTLSASNALDAVSTGAALEATTDVRAEMVFTVEPEARPPVIWLWRQHLTPGSETKHNIPDVARGNGMRGSMAAGKLAFLAYLSDVSGLGGADGVDNILRIFPQGRDQDSHNLGTPFFAAASFLADFVEDTRHLGVHPDANGSAYPYQLGTAINGVPNAATTYFLPYFWPDGGGQEVSKLQEWTGPYPIEHEYTATPSAQARWLSLTQPYIDPAHEDYLAGRMGLRADQFVAYPKVRGLHDAGDAAGAAEQAKKLRGIPKKFRAR